MLWRMTRHRPHEMRFGADLRAACGAFTVVGGVAKGAFVRKRSLCGRQAVQVATARNAILHDERVARSEDRAHYFLIRQLGGSARMDQGRSSVLSPGDFFLATSREGSEFSYPSASLQLSIHLPHDELSRLMGKTLAAGRHIAFDSVIGRALDRACRGGGADRGLEDLLALAVRDGAAPDLDLVDAAIGLTARRARDVALTPRDLADLLGVSLRRLQRALAAQQLTAGRLIQQARLSHVRRLLAERPDLTILACATEAGFADISGFNRVFRRECNMTPGQFRQAACRDSPRRR